MGPRIQGAERAGTTTVPSTWHQEHGNLLLVHVFRYDWMCEVRRPILEFLLSSLFSPLVSIQVFGLLRHAGLALPPPLPPVRRLTHPVPISGGLYHGHACWRLCPVFGCVGVHIDTIWTVGSVVNLEIGMQSFACRV